jgi:asparagine synthase (glutamine-hydrolysing)
MTGIFFCWKHERDEFPRDLEERANLLEHRGHHDQSIVVGKNTYLKTFLHSSTPGGFERNPGGFLVMDGPAWPGPGMESFFENKYPATAIYNVLTAHETGGLKGILGTWSILDWRDGRALVARDPVGHNPIYYVVTPHYVAVASEYKSLRKFEGTVTLVTPGTSVHLMLGQPPKVERFYDLNALVRQPKLPMTDLTAMKAKLYKLMDEAVQRALATEGQASALLSGGIDSSIICALATSHVPQLNVYSIGVEGSEDLRHAREVVAMYSDRMNHHIFSLTIDDILPLVPRVIYYLETFDAALIRSALPMFYLCSKVKGADVLLTGEGADELFAGYDYLKQLDGPAADQELLEMLKIEHATGMQRVDRIPYAFNIEARAPWFDLNLVEFSYRVPFAFKLYRATPDARPVEKWLIRETFQSILPASVTHREKAKFSKGAGSQFLLRDYLNARISDEDLASERVIAPGVEVKSKEELHYWRIFNEIFHPTPEFLRQLPRTGSFII